YFFARYWAEALAEQTEDPALAAHFAPIARALADGEAQIVAELHAVEGKPADLGGYYLPDADKVAAVMRPSGALNAIIG
ncbi:MAG: NADP-dependent isocitrate dehydrogenase, partial [Rhodobacteraceae bacterium]|nr:NADP-dependent isocitrate dehydrogenase [Paracoccaceae bacterium]